MMRSNYSRNYSGIAPHRISSSTAVSHSLARFRLRALVSCLSENDTSAIGRAIDRRVLWGARS